MDEIFFQCEGINKHCIIPISQIKRVSSQQIIGYNGGKAECYVLYVNNYSYTVDTFYLNKFGYYSEAVKQIETLIKENPKLLI